MGVSSVAYKGNKMTIDELMLQKPSDVITIEVGQLQTIVRRLQTAIDELIRVEDLNHVYEGELEELNTELEQLLNVQRCKTTVKLDLSDWIKDA